MNEADALLTFTSPRDYSPFVELTPSPHILSLFFPQPVTRPKEIRAGFQGIDPNEPELNS